MYDTPHLHIDTSTRVPSFFETDRRCGTVNAQEARIKLERRAGERRTMASVLRG